jgi:uncharacterized protein with ParB-like and HNH nuclease domain
MTESTPFKYDGEDEELEESFDIDEYDLTSTPNDFNVLTINSFIDSGSIKIPGFQRNYVWDIKRASKLIESIILGLPIPQIFLYEEKRNQFLVIDGQQRLMTIYFFVKGRFPKKEKRSEIRNLFNESDKFPDSVLFNDDYFTTFKLSLPNRAEDKKNPFNGLNYKTLENYQMQFDLRPIRCVVVKQNVPKDNSSVFEIFNRLNSGGINLMPQEIRCSLYHSPFIDLIVRLNLEPLWRKFLRSPDPDVHMKDVEVLLRGFAMALKGDEYKSSLATFLNKFANDAKKFSKDELSYYESFFKEMFNAIKDFPEDTFVNKTTRRFNTFLFEGLIYAESKIHFGAKTLPTSIDVALVNKMADDKVFQDFSIRGTTNKDSVTNRLARATAIIHK